MFRRLEVIRKEKADAIENDHLEKAVELLNDHMYTKRFEEDTVPNGDIILPYKIFFQMINTDQIKINSNNQFDFELWKEICEFIKKDGTKIGNIFELHL